MSTTTNSNCPPPVHASNHADLGFPLKTGAPARVHPLTSTEMRQKLETLRDVAEHRGIPFGLLVCPSIRWPAWRLTEPLRIAVQQADAWGWLPDGTLGVLLPVPSLAERLDLAPRLEELRLHLSRAGAGPIRLYGYPLTSARRRQDDATHSAFPAVVEGRMERYFALDTPLWKRAMDLGVSVAVLIVLSPLLILVALLIKATSPGPVLFRQQRTGRGGRRFVMYKFRSMVDGAAGRQAELQHLNEQDGPAFKIRRDPRITRLGWWLRETCIDELPQLWNVLRGEMSLVGPRPLPCRESAACIGWQRRRLDVTPGVTCLWQTQGRSMVSFDDWMRLDIQYVQQRSFWLDLRILAATFPILVPRGKAKMETLDASSNSADIRSP